MDDRRRRAWAALELGPLWALRDGAAAVPAHGGVTAAAVLDEAGMAEASVSGPVASAAPEAWAAVVRAAAVPRHPVDDPVVSTPPTPQTTVDATVARSQAIARMPWPLLAEAVAGCTACALCETRRRTVFGVGVEPASWMFVGEAPGEQEDERGEPFVGLAGGLLDRMLAAIGVARDRDAFIANVLKCRPPRNRDPLPEEVARCEPFLQRQIELLQPRVIVALGRFAAQSLLRTDDAIARLRGRVHRLQVGERDIPLVVTYHPAYLLRNLPDKSRAWADLRLARRVFEGGDA